MSFFKQLLRIIIIITLSTLASILFLVGTSLGTHVTLMAIKHYYQVELEAVKVSGSILTGIHIDQAIVNKLVRINSVKIQFGFIQHTPQVSLIADSINVYASSRMGSGANHPTFKAYLEQADERGILSIRKVNIRSSISSQPVVKLKGFYLSQPIDFMLKPIDHPPESTHAVNTDNDVGLINYYHDNQGLFTAKLETRPASLPSLMTIDAHYRHTPDYTYSTFSITDQNFMFELKLQQDDHSNGQLMAVYQHKHLQDYVDLSLNYSKHTLNIPKFKGKIKNLNTNRINLKDIQWTFELKKQLSAYPIFNINLSIDDMKTSRLHLKQLSGFSKASDQTWQSEFAFQSNQLPYQINLKSHGDFTSQSLSIEGSSLKKTSYLPDFKILSELAMAFTSAKSVIGFKSTTVNQFPIFPSSNPPELIITPHAIALTGSKTVTNDDYLIDLNFKYQQPDRWYFDGRYRLNNLHPLLEPALQSSPYTITELGLSGGISGQANPKDPSRPSIKGSFVVTHFKSLLSYNKLIPSLSRVNDLMLSHQAVKGHINSEEIALTGTLKTDDSLLDVQTRINYLSSLLKSEAPDIIISLKGKNTLLQNNPKAKVNANVDLELSLTANQNLAKLDIEFIDSFFQYTKPFNSGLTALPDETTVICKSNPSKNPVTPSQHKPFHYDLHLKAGPDQGNIIEYYGIKGAVDSDISIRSNSTGVPVTHGSLQLTGTVLNFDNLTIPIQKVSLQWVKTPIYDPLLDIFVERSFTIPSSQTRQTYGVSITGKLSEPQPSFFSSPKKMTPYEILASLLTHQKANVLNTKQSRDVLSLLGNQNLSEDEIIKMSRTLSAIKRMFIFDYIDYQSQELGSDSAFFRDAEIQLTRRLNKDLTLQLQLNSQKPGSGKVLLEKKINDNVSLNTYIDGSGRGGVACHITR